MDRAQQEAELESLESEHAELKRQLQRLERRAHLTPQEQVEATNLKKEKLLKKDAIFAIRNG